MIVVGCPVKNRAWSLPAWFEHVEAACAEAGEEPYYVFLGDTWLDKDSFDVIEKACSDYGRDLDLLAIEEDAQPYKRAWNMNRYTHMATIRNLLLERVRQLEPEHFWSVDSDILVARQTLVSALEARGRFDAVGSRCYMTPVGVIAPSYAMLNGSGLLRKDNRGCHKVDVIMAVKLMSPEAYNVDYVADRRGEDIGWSIAARKNKLKLGWDGRTVSKHLMSEKALHAVDHRVGF